MKRRVRQEVFTSAEIAEICDRAADEIMIRGGTKHTHMNLHTGGVCLNGAIACALGLKFNQFGDAIDVDGVETPNTINESIDRELQKTTSYFRSIFFWNDRDNRTDDERIELFRRTAKRLREET